VDATAAGLNGGVPAAVATDGVRMGAGAAGMGRVGGHGGSTSRGGREDVTLVAVAAGWARLATESQATGSGATAGADAARPVRLA